MTGLLQTAPWLYPVVLGMHQAAVAASISLFVARGCGVALQQVWPMRAVWRRTSVAVDVVLLCAGLVLWSLLGYHPLTQHWLGAKLLLLPVYVVLGSFALKRGRTRKSRMVFFLAALLCVFTMVSIAITRAPLGWWSS